MGKEERYVKPVVVIRPPESYHKNTFDSLDCICVERKDGGDGEDIFDIRVQASGKKQEQERLYSFANAVYGFGGKPIDDLCTEQIEPLLRGCLVKGESAAVIAFGETGSGKSYVSGTQNIATEQAWEGSIGAYVSRRIFELEKELDLVDLVVECSMIEIYKESLGKEQVFDLLDGFLRKKLSFACGSKQQHAVQSSDALYDHLRHGSMLRNTDRTDGNLRSSRSHAIFTIDLSSMRDGKKVFGKFMLVDLAGSESASSAVTGSQQHKQGSGINVGLSALQTVINDVSQTGKSVNYRLSRLTYDLRSVLGGGTDCDGWSAIFIGCISPFKSSGRTANTLKYIYGASKIKNIVQQNVIDVGQSKPCKHCKVLEKRIDFLEKSLGKESGQRGRVVVLGRDEHKNLLKELERAKARVFALEEVIRTADENYDEIFQENKKLLATIEELKKDTPHKESMMIPESSVSDRMSKPGLSAMALSPLMSAAELKIELDDASKLLSAEELCIVADESNLDEHQYKTLLKIVEEFTSPRCASENVDTEDRRVQRLLKERNCLVKSLHVYNEYLGSAKEERDIAQTAYQSCLDLLSQAVHEKVQYVELSAKLSHALDMSQNDVFELQNEIVGMKNPAIDSDPHVKANIFSRLLRRTQPSERDEEKSPVTSALSAPQTPQENNASSSETENSVSAHPLDEVADDEEQVAEKEDGPNHFGNRLKSFVDSWKKSGISQ